MRRIVIISSYVIAALFAVIIAVMLFDDPKARVDAVRKCFDQMPNVKVTFISDPTKQASDIISADVDVANKGRMSFSSLCPEAFGNSPHVRMGGIGPYDFRTRELVDGQERYGWTIDVGTASPIPEVRKLGITNVQSAVAHHDELLAIIINWPVITNGWPTNWPPKKGEWSKTSTQEIHFSDLPKADYYFCLRRSDSEASK
jgi:hypothetical protein